MSKENLRFSLHKIIQFLFLFFYDFYLQFFLTPKKLSIMSHKAKKATGTVLKTTLDNPCPNECAICFDIPNHRDAVITECHHIFCVKCWYSYTNSVHSLRNVHCPMCRKESPAVNMFRSKSTKSNSHLAQHTAFIESLPDRPGRAEYYRHMHRQLLQQHPAALWFNNYLVMRNYNPPPEVNQGSPQTPPSDDDVVFIQPLPREPNIIDLRDDEQNP